VLPGSTRSLAVKKKVLLLGNPKPASRPHASSPSLCAPAPNCCALFLTGGGLGGPGRGTLVDQPLLQRETTNGEAAVRAGARARLELELKLELELSTDVSAWGEDPEDLLVEEAIMATFGQEERACPRRPDKQP
jgi:hypothetical protein